MRADALVGVPARQTLDLFHERRQRAVNRLSPLHTRAEIAEAALRRAKGNLNVNTDSFHVATCRPGRGCMPLSGEMPKIALCHAEPVRHSAANGPERSEGAQGKLREASLLLSEHNCWGPFPATAGSGRRLSMQYFSNPPYVRLKAES